MPIFEDLFSLTDATSSANMKTGKKSGSIVRNGKDTRTNESIIKFMNLLGIINPRENHSNTDHFQLQKHALYPLFAYIFYPFRGFGSR